jgi:hypothetical protein
MNHAAGIKLRPALKANGTLAWRATLHLRCLPGTPLL